MRGCSKSSKKFSRHKSTKLTTSKYLESRVSLQLLPGGVSWKWLNKLVTVPKLAVNGVARFAVLRWAVNEDDDECLRLRITGSLQAEQPCVLCGTRTRLLLDSILDRRAKNAATIITSMPPPYSELTCGAYPITPLGTLLLVNFEAIFQFLTRGRTEIQVSHHASHAASETIPRNTGHASVSYQSL
jgi:hypothetical protein